MNSTTNKVKKKKTKPIFQSSFLDLRLNQYHLRKIDGIESKKEILSDWYTRYKSGKLTLQNETSIAADFLNDIFGDVLGYNYRNPHYWNLEKELKTQTDGQKPDGVLGFFNLENDLNQGVRAVIELKDANTDLDKSQNRQTDKRTPIEQAFGYAPKYGTSCKWVIASNFYEIRLYFAGDQSKCEVFTLDTLQEEEELKKFIFLLKKEHLIQLDGSSKIDRLFEKNDQFIDEQKSEKSPHLLEQIYSLIIKFDGLPYINPDIIANAPPFNKSGEPVWHYSNFTLQTSEKGIYQFFKEIEVKTNSVSISNKMEQELIQWGVTEYQEKLEYIVQRLNSSLVIRLECYEDVDKVKVEIKKSFGGSLRSGMRDYAKQLRRINLDARNQDGTCECLSCLYNDLNFRKALEVLASREGSEEHFTIESGYFHYLFATNKYKTSYSIFKELCSRKKETNVFFYFISKFNLLRLYNLIGHEYNLDDKDEIIEELKSIDLDMLLHEMDIIDKDVRKILTEIKEDKIQSHIRNKIEKITHSLENSKASYKRGSRGSFPNYTLRINQPLARFQTSYIKNKVIGNIFTDYKSISRKLLEGYLISHTIHEEYQGRLRQFEIYHINLIIFDLFPKTVEELFKKFKIQEIPLSKKAKENLCTKALNFFQSNHNETIIFEPSENSRLTQVLTTYQFKQVYHHIFSNLFFVLGKAELEGEDCRKFIPTLINFLKADKVLGGSMLHTMAIFISRYGKFFKSSELLNLLRLTSKKKGYGDEKLVESICYGLIRFHPSFELDNQIILQQTLLNIKECRGSLENLIPHWKISNTECKNYLEGIFFKELDEKFEPYFYWRLLIEGIVDLDFKNYFEQYIDYVNTVKKDGAYKLWNGEPELEDLHFINFAVLLFTLNIDRKDRRIQKLTNLCDWHEWLLNLDSFDYSKFKTDWILIFHRELFFKRFGKTPKIKGKIKEALKEKYYPRLGEIYVKYFC